jgi:hypothetical protein
MTTENSHRNIFQKRKGSHWHQGHFAPSPEWGSPPEACEAIIAVDGIGSSHGFHCHDPVWNTQVSGMGTSWNIIKKNPKKHPERRTTQFL